MKGCAYTVEITGRADELGAETFGCDIQGLTNEMSVTFESLVAAFLRPSIDGSRALRRALADFRRAILEPDDTPFHCYRAVEALSYYFSSEKSSAWDGLRQALNIDREWIKANLQDPAGDIRHGRVVGVTGETRLRTLNAATLVTSRFAVLLLSGTQRLQLVDYPTIS
ncbi:hypothetical protein AYO38_02300 [bacterium SCGC AG-212-C10]|nr:hypothetical protein AYO38_02300 [bacterium SCGC AG-212-C10]